MGGCADSCSPYQTTPAKPGDYCTIWEGFAGCNSSHIEQDNTKLYTQWTGGRAEYHCDGEWRKDGGGSGGGTYRCFAKQLECNPDNYKIQGYWEYDKEASTVGGVSKSKSTTVTTEYSNSETVKTAFSKAFKTGVSMEFPNVPGLAAKGSETTTFSEETAAKYSHATSETTTSETNIGGKCPRAVWRWVFKGVDSTNPKCDITVKPGEYTAYTTSSSDAPCCLPGESLCDSNAHNPCLSGKTFLCGKDFKETDGCTESCQSLANCTDLKRGACPV